MARVYPLSGAFMVIALMGLIFSAIMFTKAGADSAEAAPVEEEDAGYDLERAMLFSLMFLFALMLIASIISLTYGPETAQ